MPDRLNELDHNSMCRHSIFPESNRFILSISKNFDHLNKLLYVPKIAETGIWTQDLQIMTLASYRTALSRDIIFNLSWLYSLMDNHKVLAQTLILTITIGFYRKLAINTWELYIVKIDNSEFSIWSLNIEHSIFFAYTVRIQYLPSDIN